MTTTDTCVFRTRRSDMAMLAPQRWDEAVDEITRELMQIERFDRQDTRKHVETVLKRQGRCEVAGVIYETIKKRTVVYR